MSHEIFKIGHSNVGCHFLIFALDQLFQGWSLWMNSARFKQKNIGLSYVSFCERSKLVGPLQSLRIPWWPCALQWKRLCFWRSSLENFMINGPDILWCSDRKLAVLQFQMECWGMIWKMLLLYLYKAHCITKLQIFWLNAGGILPISFVTKIRDVRNLSRKVDFQLRRTFANNWG